MTSDMADRSAARNNLDYILGGKRVSLGELNPEEFDEFLEHILTNLDLRELRGFKTLRKLIERQPGSFIYGRRQDPLETLEMSENVQFENHSWARANFDLETHVVAVCRGLLIQNIVYRQYESGEETADWKVATKWGNKKYPHRGDETTLCLHRPNNHRRADENLFEVSYQIEKVPQQDMMTVKKIVVHHLPLNAFRAHYGARYPSVARDLIWEVDSLIEQTHDDLKNKAEQFGRRRAELERIAKGIRE